MQSEQQEIDPPNSGGEFEIELAGVSALPMRASPFIYCIEEPLGADRPRRWRRIVGWCVSENARPPARLRLRVGDKQFEAPCSYDRPDVASYLHQTVSDVRCGFSFIIETVTPSTLVSLSASCDSDDWTLIFSSSMRGSKIASPADRAEKERWELLDNSARYAWWFDRPGNWPGSTDPLYICGWCVDRMGAPVRGLRAKTERNVFPAKIGIQRRDVRAIFPGLQFAHCSGFAIEVALPSGAGTLDLELLGSDERWHLFDRRSYFERRRRTPAAALRAEERDVFRAAAGGVVSRFAFWLEPRCNWSRMPKRQRLAGWCVALDGPPIAEIRAITGAKKSLARYGLMRSEVKAAFPGVPGAVDSGFLVTVEPSLGSSELVLEARSRDGKWEPFMRRRVHRPLFWGRHENAYGDTDDYSVWIKLYDRLTWRDRRSIRRHIRQLPIKPKFSILLPAYNSNPRFLRRAIASLRAQLYVNWELCAADDASDDPAVWSLLQRAARQDQRIKIVRRTDRGNISLASNAALDLASGAFIGFLDHDDELAPTALYYVALERNRNPTARIIYTDEDKLDDNGKRFSPYFKSSWDPEFFLTQNYLAHFCLIDAEFVRRAGGFRSGFEGAQDYDLVLRCVEQIGPGQVAHIPRIGYHWRSAEGSTAETTAAKPYAHGAALRAVQEHLDRRGIDAQAVEDCGIYQRVKYRLPTRPPLVSIIIPTRDRVELLRKCIGSLARQTNYPTYEIILVDNGSTEADTTDYYASLANEPGIELLRHPGDFNFSRLCNAGVEAAHGEIVVLLNNDVEILDPDWLTEMVSLALRPDVGAVGARLWGPDGRLQHGGIVLSRHNIGSYAHFGLRRTDLGYFAKLHLTQNVSAVTAACLATRREVYQRAGGLNERELAIAFNDVDFCLRLRAAGLRVIWTPNADLVHYESSSRGLEDTAEKQDRFHREIAYMRERWGEVLDRDPFYNPNLSLGTELFTLALPPRIEPPWLHRGKNLAGTAPHSVMPEEGLPSDYAFGFDAPIDPIVFESELAVSGWLVQREGKPIRGIRATVRRKFSKRQVFRARRKRRRPDVAASFPELPDAIASGFLIEVRLGKGRSSLSFEVQDDERVWRTFHTAGVTAIPLNLLTRIGFDRVRQVAARSLKHASSSRQKEHTIRQVESKPRPTLASALRTARVDVFATSKSNLFILEIGELVAAGFREAGCDARVRVDEIPAENTSPETVQIVLTPHEYYNLFLTERLRRSEARRITQNVVLLSTEQPETGWFQSNLGWAVHARAVADINPLGVAAYRSRGLRAFHLPLGFHPLLGDGSHLPLNHREYDITFLGSMTSRRERFFAEHAPFFSEHRCHLRLVPLGFAKTKDTRSYLSVAARNEVLTQSKILLNVHYSDQKYFEWHRMLVGIANGCCIITEKCLGYGPLVPGKHFVMVESEDLIPSCKYFLAHPEECAAIANSAATFIQTELRQAQLCRSFLAEFEADLARSTRDGAPENGAIAPDLADSNPQPLPPELTRQLSAGSLRHFGTALREDLRNLLSEVSPRQRRERPLIAQDVSPAELREAVLEKRRGYAERWQTQEKAAAEELPIFQLHENRAVGTGREPQLSVVITLYNYARYIGDCVTSIERAAERLNDALEVVIVNDASTDRSLREALRSATTSRLPIRIANKKWNTGLADARNKGVQLARGDYVFIMDADNLIFPNALKQLLDVLKTGSFAAAYSLLCRFRGTPGHRVGLLSHFDWDPQILVQHPYIDAMAMFRREALLELSGYDNQLSQIGWFGWEDYDLWLRFALKDYPVGFVPNVLCLYRHHDTSMINTTNLFSAELVRHFMANYGELLDRFDPSATIFGVPRERIPELEKRDSRFVPTT